VHYLIKFRGFGYLLYWVFLFEISIIKSEKFKKWKGNYLFELEFCPCIKLLLFYYI